MEIPGVKTSENQFDLLREKGLEYIRTWGGKEWTDHNQHDPGITILEQLCYALTDLQYRIGYDVPDLLATETGDPYNSLFSPAKILSVNPVTLSDLRKVVMDIDFVKNAWIEQVTFPFYYQANEKRFVVQETEYAVGIRGLYKVWIDVYTGGAGIGSSVVAEVYKRLADCRSLCEDILDIEVIKPQPVTVKATIEVGELDDPELFVATVYQQMEDYMSPSVRFYTLQEMREKNYTLSDIMNGPVLRHGFIDDNDLPGLEKRETLYVSDLISLLHQVPGLQAIKNIQLQSGEQVKDWRLDIGAGLIPRFDNNPETDTNISLQKNGIAIRFDKKRVAQLFSNLKRKIEKKLLPVELKDIVLPRREERSIEKYYSIQNHFPLAYTLGDGQLPDSADAKRKAQRDQLRGYLFFFDQVLANQFSQVAHLKDIFSYENTGTYFNQRPSSVPGLSSMINKPNEYEALHEEEEEMSQRKNRLLNHLMARFSEDFTHFSLLLPNLKDIDDCAWKSNFLKHYPEISGGRGKGINYLNNFLPEGLEKRIRIKLGVEASNDQGFYLVEHLLLRPTAKDGKQQPAFMYAENSQDQFSLQVSYLLPEYLEEHQQLIHGILREETPAHIRIFIGWLTEQELRDFAPLYKSWRLEMASPTSSYKLRGLRNRIIDSINLGITYPICDLPVHEKNKIIPYNYVGKFTIQDSEKDIVYELYKRTKKGEEKTSISRIGNGEDVLVETEPLTKDSQFVIYAIKKVGPVTLRVLLTKELAYEIGIDKNLDVLVKDTTSIVFGTTTTIIIKNSQEKVEYKLVSLKGEHLSDSIVGPGGELRIETYPLFEDTEVILKASKVFDEDDPEVSDDDSEDVEIRKLMILVKPNLTLEAEAAPAVNAFVGATSIRIKETQKSVWYQVLYAAFDEDSILYDTAKQTEHAHLKYPADDSPERELLVLVPAGLQGFEASTLVQGTDGDLLIGIPSIATNLVWYVRAVKQRKENPDDLFLKKKSLALVQPRIDLEWSAPENVARGAMAEITIKNPQRGIIYQLVTPDGKTLIGSQVVFHKNKPIERARVKVDLVVHEFIEDVVVLITPWLTGKTNSYRIKAIDMYTGVASTTDRDIVIAANE